MRANTPLDTHRTPDEPNVPAEPTPAVHFTLHDEDGANEEHQRLLSLCGHCDSHLKQIEQRLKVDIHHRGNQFAIHGLAQQAELAKTILQKLFAETADKTNITPEEVHLTLQEAGAEELSTKTNSSNTDGIIRTKKCTIKPRGPHQLAYVQAVEAHDINFGIGPAGTGKTYLAVACAVQALLNNDIERILLVRPAVEAGEKLGFLPGDLSQKVDPYLRPLYDALYEMLGFEAVGKLLDRHIIEVAPLAYMRGRTLNNSFIILDESQNTTKEQMKMFLTRIGFGSTAVITGDPTQVDLPRGTSGLKHAVEVLAHVSGISFTHFDSKDVVRHPIVQRIVEAYSVMEDKTGTGY